MVSSTRRCPGSTASSQSVPTRPRATTASFAIPSRANRRSAACTAVAHGRFVVVDERNRNRKCLRGRRHHRRRRRVPLPPREQNGSTGARSCSGASMRLRAPSQRPQAAGRSSLPSMRDHRPGRMGTSPLRGACPLVSHQHRWLPGETSSSGHHCRRGPDPAAVHRTRQRGGNVRRPLPTTRGCPIPGPIGGRSLEDPSPRQALQQRDPWIHRRCTRQHAFVHRLRSCHGTSLGVPPGRASRPAGRSRQGPSRRPGISGDTASTASSHSPFCNRSAFNTGRTPVFSAVHTSQPRQRQSPRSSQTVAGPDRVRLGMGTHRRSHTTVRPHSGPAEVLTVLRTGHLTTDFRVLQ